VVNTKDNSREVEKQIRQYVREKLKKITYFHIGFFKLAVNNFKYIHLAANDHSHR